MAEIVNLRQARKRKARAADEQRATENRAVFGRSKEHRTHDEAKEKLAECRLDQHRIGGDERE